MAKIDVIMPQMGESIAEGTLSKWLKKVGDAVKRDEPIFEISTDKVDAEIPSPNAGVLAEILVQEGQTVAMQTVVARIETDARAVAGAAPAAAPAPAAARAPRAAAAPAARGRSGAQPAPSAPAARFHCAASQPPAGNGAEPRRNGSVASPRRWSGRSRRSTASTSARSRVPGPPAG